MSKKRDITNIFVTYLVTEEKKRKIRAASCGLPLQLQ